jgi:polar amino acid transport system substrate-binding protein
MDVRTAIASAVLATSIATAALAQQNDVPQISRDLYQDRLRQEGDSVTICINPDAMLADFDTEVAQAIGDALLININFDYVKPKLKTLPFDYRLPFSTDQLFVLMAEECDGFMGFTLTPAGYPTWMRVTQAYLDTRMVLVVADPTIDTLDELPRDQPIGARSLSAADNQLLIYLNARPEADRWPRHAFFDHTQVMAKLKAGEIGAALLWEPAWKRAALEDPAIAAFKEIPLPFPTVPVSFGIVTRTVDSYLLINFDDAIEALKTDGVLDEIAQAHGL